MVGQLSFFAYNMLAFGVPVDTYVPSPRCPTIRYVRYTVALQRPWSPAPTHLPAARAALWIAMRGTCASRRAPLQRAWRALTGWRRTTRARWRRTSGRGQSGWGTDLELPPGWTTWL